MSTPVSSDVRLVADASQSDAVKLSAQSPGYGASNTGLTDSWGPHKAEDGALKTYSSMKSQLNVWHLTEIAAHF